MEIIEGLLRLEAISSFKNTGLEAEMLSKYYELVQNPFDYFLKGLSISRGLQEKHSTDNCPSETDIAYFATEELAGNPDPAWTKHKEECYACNHTCASYHFLIENIWQALHDTRSLLIANAILAYLRNDPAEVVSVIFNDLQKLEDGEYYEMHGDEERYVRGILSVKQTNVCKNSLSRHWYGLVRRALDVMGAKTCVLCPPTPDSPVFRVDFTNNLNKMYFMLWNGKPETAKGLHLYFPADKTRYLPNGCFISCTTGTSSDGLPRFSDWEATFYGKIS